MAAPFCAARDCESATPHVHCASCGLPTASAICPHHTIANDEWAAANRVWCDLLHRKKVPPRLAPDERDPAIFEYA